MKEPLEGVKTNESSVSSLLSFTSFLPSSPFSKLSFHRHLFISEKGKEGSEVKDRSEGRKSRKKLEREEGSGGRIREGRMR